MARPRAEERRSRPTSTSRRFRQDEVPSAGTQPLHRLQRTRPTVRPRCLLSRALLWQTVTRRTLWLSYQSSWPRCRSQASTTRWGCQMRLMLRGWFRTGTTRRAIQRWHHQRSLLRRPTATEDTRGRGFT
ncbi:unnamed protein product [Ectocarpus sp. 13 AM-2016]